jgi:hypothetical protein
LQSANASFFRQSAAPAEETNDTKAVEGSALGHDNSEEEEVEEHEEDGKQQPKPKMKGAPQPKLLRGQKGKMKKMKKKYAEQDEEERDLRMQLLQVPPSPQMPANVFVVWRWAVGGARLCGWIDNSSSVVGSYSVSIWLVLLT